MKTIEIISIPVSDQQASKAFYQKLGFELLVDIPFGKDQQWIQLGFPGSQSSITLVTWFEKMPPGSVQGLVIKSEDVEGDYQNLLEKGIAVAPIDKTPWGKFASFKDPDGNGLSFHQQ